jgi:hypothetical protein
MDSKYIVNIYCETYHDICKEMGVGNFEVDYKLGLRFIKTVQLDYIFEIKDKEKWLWAKLTYDI